MGDRTDRRATALHLHALLLLAAFVLGTTNAAAAPVLPADTTAMLTGAPSLRAPLDTPVAGSAISAQATTTNGTLVAFSSDSDGLAADDDDDVTNIYVRNMTTGAVELISRRSGASGAPATADCFSAAISDDGRRVAFTCTGPLDTADTNSVGDVYVRDRVDQLTHLVSRVSGGGAVANGGGSDPSINGDGTRIAFVSGASNLVSPAPTVGAIYRRVLPLPWQITAQETTLVSRADGAGGANPNQFCQSPSISNSGTEIAFSCHATNLVTGDTNNASDVFVRTLTTHETELVSRKDGGTGTIGNDDSRVPTLSGDGTTVAFQSSATNLSDDDISGNTNVYRRSRTTDSTNLVDVVAGSVASSSSTTSIDDTGAAITFTSSSTGLDPADPGALSDVFVSRNGTAIEVVSRPDGAGTPAANQFAGRSSVSGNGTKFVFETSGSVAGDVAPGVTNLAVRDTSANTTRSASRPGTAPFVNAGGPGGPASLSADGRFAAVAVAAPALGAPATVPSSVVVRDTATGASVLASRATGEGGAPLRTLGLRPSLSADGTRVAFITIGADGESDVWVRDLPTATTTLVSRANGAAGPRGTGTNTAVAISGDGRRVAFLTTSANLQDGDGDTQLDVHVRDIDAGTTTLVSRATGAAGAKANQPTSDIAIDFDGDRIAFNVPATNFGDGVAATLYHVRVRDTSAQTTTLVDVAPGGAPGDKSASGASISADGQRVAFASAAGNLGVPGTPFGRVWVRDLPTATNILATVEPDGDPSEGGRPQLSADGTVVAFVSDEALAGGATGTAEQVFRRDLAAGTTALVSRRDGPDGAEAPALYPGGLFAPPAADLEAITADGACVAFDARGDLLGGSTDFQQAYLRTFVPDCGRPFPPDPPPAAGGTPAPVAGSGSPPRAALPAAPRLTRVSLSRTRFRVGPGRTATSAQRKRRRVAAGTTVRFTLNVPATVTLRVERLVRGRRVGKNCLKATRARRARPKCDRPTAAGTLTRRSPAGPRTVAFSGRVGAKKLAAGRYRLTLVATDTLRRRSPAVVKPFTVASG